MQGNPKSNGPPATAQRDTFLTFFDLVVQISHYVDKSAEALHRSRPVRDSQVRARMLSETLSSTRMRAKHSLDTLAAFTAETQVGKRRLQYNAVTEPLQRIVAELEADHSTSDLLDVILACDQDVQNGLEQQLGVDTDLAEDLGQLLTIITMMRRACSFIINTERDVG